MLTLDLHPQRDLKQSGEKGKLKDSLNIIIQKLSCFVISKMVRVKGIFHTLFVILDLRALSQDISFCIQPKRWKLLRRGSIGETYISIFLLNWTQWIYSLGDSLSWYLHPVQGDPSPPFSCMLQIEKMAEFSNRVCRDETLSSFNCMHIVISQAHEITLWNCNYELIIGLSNC